jgi:hypothetical protein
MKLNYLLSAILIGILLACDNQDDLLLIPVYTTAAIDGESFSPTKCSASKTGGGLILSFTEGAKKILIMTNDTIIGTYIVILKSSKSAMTLTANLEYNDGITTYYGNSGTFMITKNEGGKISGIYNSTVVSDNGKSININSGSYLDIQTVSIIETETAINDTLTLCYSDWYEYIEFSYVFDAVYANISLPPNSSWTEIYEHTQSQAPTNEKILNLWSEAYDIISKTNLIIYSSEMVISDELTRNKINAQAKAIRAYLFYNLMIWFGEIPVETDIPDTLNPRGSIAEVLKQIKEDATEAINYLPVNWSTIDNFRIPKFFMSGLLARISITDFQLPNRWPPPQPFLYGDCNEAISTSRQIINSAIYSLGYETNNFSESNNEIIWGFNKMNDNEFSNIFKKGTCIPVLRLTEIYLILSEALYQKGNTLEAITLLNQLNSRRGNSPVSSIIANEIFSYWNSEIVLEGSRFITLRRFNKALIVVQNSPGKILLPIPFPVLIKNHYLTQNIGY